jgi:hypothetical protein
MSEDDIAAVRRVRHEISKECDHSIEQYFEYLRSVQEELRRSGEFRFAEPVVSGSKLYSAESISRS